MESATTSVVICNCSSVSMAPAFLLVLYCSVVLRCQWFSHRFCHFPIQQNPGIEAAIREGQLTGANFPLSPNAMRCIMLCLIVQGHLRLDQPCGATGFPYSQYSNLAPSLHQPSSCRVIHRKQFPEPPGHRSCLCASRRYLCLRLRIHQLLHVLEKHHARESLACKDACQPSCAISPAKSGLRLHGRKRL